MKIILLNGPPRCGKDTAGRILRSLIPDCELYGFADEVKRMTCRALGIADHWTAFELHKDEPLNQFGGLTPRECYIQMSEEFAKPLFGTAYFGRQAALAMQRRSKAIGDHVAVVTDSGFREEAMALCGVFGSSNVRRVKLSRPGRSFAGDSRGYWEVIPSVVDYAINNDDGLDELRATIEELVGDMAGWLAVPAAR